MMEGMAETNQHSHEVVIDGHLVDTRLYPIDRFYDGRTGARVTDAQWDAESALIAQHQE